jgi:sarcosine oxidase, subunit beta
VDLVIDVLVIGGGLAGTASAYYLAQEGLSVSLLEAGDLNTLASGSNAGSLHAQIPHEPFVTYGEEWARGFAPAIPILMEGIRLWTGLEAELGLSLEVATPGGLLVAATQAQMRDIERKTLIERANGLPVELLSRDDLRRIAPYVAEGMVGGSLSPIEGKANPLHAAPAFAAAAAALGADIIRFTPALSIEREEAGFVVRTPEGSLRARRIVNAAGAAAGKIARMVGLDLPIEGFPIQVTVTEPVAPLVRHLLYYAGDKLTLKQTPAGSILIGGGWPSRLDPETGRLSPSLESLLANVAIACHVVPGIAAARVVRTWPAIVNGTQDWRPILGELPGVPGFFMNMFPWMGFTAAPACARIVADLIVGRRPNVDLAPFDANATAA